MKKLLTLGIACLISLPYVAQAEEYCDDSMGNLSFYSAGIDEKGKVGCSYRYCYYTCTYDGYTIPGKFKPDPGKWVKEPGKKSYSCLAENSPGACPFHRAKEE